jgi:glycosyltransferase involved in cell wall biosynthesis
MISRRSYTNFVSIPIIKNRNGELFTDALWAKDIQLHLEYIECFNLCCPVVLDENTSGLENISQYKINKIIPLKMDYGFISILKNLAPNFLSVIQACKHADIVHSGGAGWAFPLSFYILPLRLFMKFQWVIMIESSFWLLNKSDKRSFRNVFEHLLYKHLLKRCVKNADARIFTQSFYRTLFLGDEIKNTMINPASWVDQEKILTDEKYQLHNQNQINKPIEFIFPARLIEEKGVKLLFEAVLILRKMDLEANITIVGNGPLKEDVVNFANKSDDKIKVVYLTPVEYGDAFYQLLLNYDIVLVPNLKEEQPRIIFDAFSQGKGVIASDTSGILDIVEPNKNALIFKAGDAADFAQSMAKALQNPSEARMLGEHGLSYVKNKTHLNMHKERLVFLKSSLNLD